MDVGGVLVIFSLFKLFDISAFAADFAKYDLLAMRVRTYGRAYAIELKRGLAFLGFWQPDHLRRHHPGVWIWADRGVPRAYRRQVASMRLCRPGIQLAPVQRRGFQKTAPWL